MGEVELRLPTDAELVDLAEVAVAGIHDPALMPFLQPWTRGSPQKLRHRFMQHHWGSRASWSAREWTLNLGVWAAGEAVGSQSLVGTEFAIRRSVQTGSWLGLAYQGRGIGTAMRAAVLALAFEGLGALDAQSGAFADNPASMAVSLKLGYQRNGLEFHDVEGRRAVQHRLLLTREAWESVERPTVQIEGLDACRELFGPA